MGPTMVSATTVATELIAIAAVGGGLYLFLRDGKSSEAQPASDSSTAVKKDPIAGVEDTEPGPPAFKLSDVTPPGAIVGLAAPVARREDDEPQPNPKIEPMPNLDSVGVDLDRYMKAGKDDGTELKLNRPVEDELSWASGALADLPGCGGSAIVDKNGNVKWTEGSLINESTARADWVDRFVGGDAIDVDVQSLPLLASPVKSAVVVPIGTEGAALVLASAEPHFFGPLEMRTAAAVSARLEFALRANESAAASAPTA